jgi:hypothetical protein
MKRPTALILFIVMVAPLYSCATTHQITSADSACAVH